MQNINHMKHLFKIAFAVIIFSITTSIASAQTIDDSNTVNRLLSLAKCDSTVGNAFLTGLKYKLVSKSVKALSTSNATFSKYKLADSAGSYTLVSTKGGPIGALCITYSKAIEETAVADALKMGFKLKESPNSEFDQTVYSRGTERFIVKKAVSGDKTFYTLSGSDLTIAVKSMEVKTQ